MIIISPILRMIAGIVSIILYIVTAISCYGGIIPPEVTPLGSVLVIGMPVLLTVSAIVTLAWFCFGHWMTGSLGVVMFLACAGPIKMWFPLGSKEDPAPGNPTFTIMTWNILHGEDLGEPSNKGSRTMEAILEYDPDIVCMQEMTGFEKKDLRHFSQASVDSILARYPYRLGIGTTYDICILSKYPLRHIYFGSVNSFILAEYCTVKIGGREIALANIHLPSFALDENEKTIFSPHGDKEQKEDLSKRIFHKLQHAFPIRAQAAEKVVHGFERLAMPVVVVGDFNDVPASWTYRMFLKAGFKDAYCATNFFPTYTIYPHAFYFHLDQVMYRGNLRPLSVDRLNIRTSDHLPQLATFEILPNY